MALKIYSSNHIETLQASLSSTLLASPLDNPFTAETIVTPTYALGRWLNLQLARELGIAANINYLRPAQWFWQLAQQYLPELPNNDVYGRAVMAWELYDCLDALPQRSVFREIRQYCETDETGIKRWQLAQRLADCFDRYQWYRPDMIEAWSAGKDNQWQACLWRLLIERLGPQHRPYQVETLIGALSDHARQSNEVTRISLFALSELPPLYLSVLEALASHCELDLYIHSPTDQYWADLRSQKQLGQQRLQNPDQASLFETGNELLSAWGRQGQIFQDLLLQADLVESLDIALYQPPSSTSLLQSIQASIFNLSENRQTIAPDDSISVHVCHSVMRECQVLHDQLLDLLNRDANLQPEDILVMIPNISAYAASIESVFRYQNNHGLACNLSDLSLAHEHPSVVSFLQLVALPESRFTRSDILGLLDNPTLRYQLGIDAQGHQDIIDFINQSRVRWGIDGQHKTGFGLPATTENTWQQARDRFFASYAFDDAGLWNDIALLPSEDGRQSQQLAHFWYFFEQLADWKSRLAAARSATEWRILLNDLLSQFFGESESASTGIQQIRNGINSCLPESNTTLAHRLVLDLLEEQLYQVEQPGQLYSGGVTFCGLRPMRNVPFKVICLLGMNHDEFPRQDKPAEFDLMNLQPRGGDPANRLQDRYLMLETLLCCREKLYISYCGRSLKDNNEQPASTLVDELLDYIDALFVPEAEGPGLASQLRKQHPMQAYSRQQFSGGHFSYSPQWLEISENLARRPAKQAQAWPTDDIIELNPQPVIAIDDMRRCLQNPLRYFFTEMLGIRLFTERPESDEEAFELDGLQRWQLRQQLANSHLKQQDDSLALMRAEGQLPHGAAAISSFNRISAEAEEWLHQLDDFRGLQQQSLLVNLQLEKNLRLNGRVSHYFPGQGLMSVYAGQMKGWHLLSCWFDHLLLSATGQLSSSENSRLINKDNTRQFEPVETGQARDYLQQYCQVFHQGRQRPLPFFPSASFTWAQSGDEEKARNNVWRDWENQFRKYDTGDEYDPYIGMMLRETGTPPFNDTEFGELASKLYSAALDHGVSR